MMVATVVESGSCGASTGSAADWLNDSCGNTMPQTKQQPSTASRVAPGAPQYGQLVSIAWVLKGNDVF
jgi:hypothetical protein